jgi:hypothetical protein
MSEHRHVFTCGACGTSVTEIYLLSGVKTIMQLHAGDCPGFPPSPDLQAAETIADARAAILGAESQLEYARSILASSVLAPSPVPATREDT